MLFIKISLYYINFVNVKSNFILNIYFNQILFCRHEISFNVIPVFLIKRSFFSNYSY